MAKVKLENINKFFGKNQILHDVDLEIEDGEFVVLVGPSGCGKSTTLRIIAGLEEITSGSVMIGDRIVNDVAPKNRDIAMVFQNYALYPHMSVWDNMAFGLKLRKTAAETIQKFVSDASALLDIDDLLKRKPKELSGGQRQRVAVGRAIVRKPKVFLFDEPLSNLDAKLRVQMRTEIKKLHKALRTTMIYVTHDQVEAMTMGDRIVVMKDGYIMQDDSPINVFSRPANQFVAGFIGSPAMNFFTVGVRKEDGTLVADEGSFKLEISAEKSQMLAPYVDREVVLGVRPEHVVITHDDTGFEGILEVCELMGSESNFHLKTGRHQFTAKVPETVMMESGSRISFDIMREFVHFFDSASGYRLD